MVNIHTHYDNLKVARNAPVSVIKAAYKALCQTYHPDKFQGSNKEAERIMKLVNGSYGILIDPVQRALHDVWIRKQEAKQHGEDAHYGKTDEATTNNFYQRRDKHDVPHTEGPPPSAKKNHQSYSTATEAEIKQKWEHWRNNEQKRYKKQQSWSPNGYWETYTMKRTIQEFVIALFFIGGLFYVVSILSSKLHEQKEHASISHQVQTQSVHAQQAPPSNTNKAKADSSSVLDSPHTKLNTVPP